MAYKGAKMNVDDNDNFSLEDFLDEVSSSKSDFGKGKKDQKETKAKRDELHHNVIRAMLFSPHATLPEFPTIFHVMKDHEGQRRVIQEDPETKICRGVVREEVTASIQQYTDMLYKSGMPDYLYTVSDTENCATRFIRKAEIIDDSDIAIFAYKSEDKRCWEKLSFDIPEVKQPTPTFDEIFSRCTNSNAVKAFIGSIFIPESYRQQALWLYGQGQDGKSSLLNLLKNMLGSLYSSTNQPDSGNKRFWQKSFLDKRLVCIDDCDDPKLLSYGFVKSVISSDTLAIEGKNKDAFNGKSFSKFCVCSNHKPLITSQKSEQRRLIFSEFKTYEGKFDFYFHKKLEEEGPSFLKDCIDTYYKLCPGHCWIPVELNELAEVTALAEEDFQTIFDNNFTVDKEGFVSARKMKEILEEEKDRFFNKRSFKNFLEKMGAKYQAVRNPDSSIIKAWKGIRLLDAAEKETRLNDDSGGLKADF